MGESARDRSGLDADGRSAIERRVARSFVDEQGIGRPLSRRTRQTRRSVESYLAAGVLPRYMERLRQIEVETATQRGRLERSYRALQQGCAADAGLFARRWVEIARRWRFDRVNELIGEHNDWYPIERDLPMDPRTGDYVRIAGRPYRREPLDARWVLERFPPELPAAGPPPG